MGNTTLLPLFPLNTVLFPNMPLPLYIFEPRYKTLITDCLRNSWDFGVVLVQPDGLAKVGTSARIENVLQRFEDGRMNLLTLGKTRFRIHEVFDEGPYLKGKVDFWDDDDPNEEVDELYKKVRSYLRDYARLTGKLSESAIFENYSAYSFSFFLAELNMYTVGHQQEVLEMTSTRTRLEKGTQSLEFLLGRLRLDQKLQKILGTRQSFFNIYN